MIQSAFLETWNAYIIRLDSILNLRPWVHCFLCIFNKKRNSWAKISSPNLNIFMIWNLPLRFFFSISLFTVVATDKTQLDFLKNHWSERLEKSCWNTLHTSICKMLVVSLDFFPFIILPALSYFVDWYVSQQHKQSASWWAYILWAYIQSIMMKQKKTREQEQWREKMFMLFAEQRWCNLFQFPSLLIDSDCIFDNQWKICSMSLLRKIF